MKNNNIDTYDEFKRGEQYLFGDGVERSLKKAFAHFMVSAEGGLGPAQYNVGMAYASGEGVNQDIDLALHWFSRAAEQGLPEAQYKLAEAALEGFGGPIDPDKAFYWFEKAACQGHTEAQSELGKLYKDGQGVKKDYAKAAFWFKEAGMSGSIRAQIILSDLHKEVFFTLYPLNNKRDDLVDAYMWAYAASEWSFVLATVDDSEQEDAIMLGFEAQFSMSLLEASMSKNEIAKAKNNGEKLLHKLFSNNPAVHSFVEGIKLSGNH